MIIRKLESATVNVSTTTTAAVGARNRAYTFDSDNPHSLDGNERRYSTASVTKLNDNLEFMSSTVRNHLMRRDSDNSISTENDLNNNNDNEEEFAPDILSNFVRKKMSIHDIVLSMSQSLQPIMTPIKVSYSQLK